MRAKSVRVAAGLLTLGMLAAAGCSDSRMLATGNYVVDFQVGATKADQIPPFDCAIVRFGAILIEPQDGLCDNSGLPCGDDLDCNGGTCEGDFAGGVIDNTIRVFEPTSPVRVRMTDTQCTEPTLADVRTDLPEVTLAAGRYIIRTLRAGALFIDRSPPEPNKTCGTSVLGLVPFYPPEDLTFVVGEGQPNVVRFQLDMVEAANVTQSQDGCLAFIQQAATVMPIL